MKKKKAIKSSKVEEPSSAPKGFFGRAKDLLFSSAPSTVPPPSSSSSKAPKATPPTSRSKVPTSSFSTSPPPPTRSKLSKSHAPPPPSSSKKAASAISPPTSSRRRSEAAASKASKPVARVVGSSSSSARPAVSKKAPVSTSRGPRKPVAAAASSKSSRMTSASSSFSSSLAPSKTKGKKKTSSKMSSKKKGGKSKFKAVFKYSDDEDEEQVEEEEEQEEDPFLAEKLEVASLGPTPEEAAAEIQRTFRGHMARKEVDARRRHRRILKSREDTDAPPSYEPFEGLPVASMPYPMQHQQQQQQAVRDGPSELRADMDDFEFIQQKETPSYSPFEGFETLSSAPPVPTSAPKPKQQAKKGKKKGVSSKASPASGAGAGGDVGLHVSGSGRHLLDGSGMEMGTFPVPIPASLPFIPRSDLALNPKPVGAGSFGVVYACKYAGERVAVKVPNSGPPDLVLEQIDALFKELIIQVKATTHPHVVRFLGLSWVTPPPDVLAMIESPLGLARLEMPWVVMEYMDGGDVLQLVRKEAAEGRAIPVPEMARLAREAALGIAHLHSQGVVHRDIACRNLMMHAGTVKVGDFGLARVVSNPYAMGGTSSKVGPLKWEAPETVLTRVYGPPSDVYSFGVACYEIVTGGKEPWEGMEPVQAALAVTQGKSLASLLPATVDPRLADIIRRCLTPVTSDRPKMSAIAEELKALATSV